MMARKLAALLSILGVVALFGTWLLHRALALPTMPAERILNYGVLILVVYFWVGMFVAKVGVSLIREVMAERRSRDEEKRFNARNRYEALLGEGEAAGVEGAPAEGAPAPKG
mgnify:CR=1 FL=1